MTLQCGRCGGVAQKVIPTYLKIVSYIFEVFCQNNVADMGCGAGAAGGGDAAREEPMGRWHGRGAAAARQV